MTHNLHHRAAQATADIENAKTSLQKRDARNAGLAVHAELAKHLADESFKSAFLNEKKRSMVGVYKGDAGLVADHPVFMIGPLGTKITGKIKLPDGSLAAPNPQYQITVPAHLVPQMLARGFLRFNDDAIADLTTALGDPVRPHA